MADPIVLEFEKEKDTKNTVRFKEKADGVPAIGTLYIQKDNLSALDNPAALKVEISAA